MHSAYPWTEKVLVLGAGMSGLTAALFSLPDLAYHFGDQNLFWIRGGNELLPQAMAELLSRLPRPTSSTR